MAEKGVIAIPHSLVAGADLSAAQYAPVAIDANGEVVLANVPGDNYIGVTEGKHKLDDHCTLTFHGVTKGRVGGAVTPGQYLTVQSGWFIGGNKGTFNNSLWTNQGSLTKLVAQSLVTVASGGVATIHAFPHPTMVASA